MLPWVDANLAGDSSLLRPNSAPSHASIKSKEWIEERWHSSALIFGLTAHQAATDDAIWGLMVHQMGERSCKSPSVLLAKDHGGDL